MYRTTLETGSNIQQSRLYWKGLKPRQLTFQTKNVLPGIKCLKIALQGYVV